MNFKSHFRHCGDWEIEIESGCVGPQSTQDPHPGDRETADSRLMGVLGESDFHVSPGTIHIVNEPVTNE